jgi:hypothetical protein
LVAGTAATRARAPLAGRDEGEGAARGEHDANPLERRAALRSAHHPDGERDRGAGHDEHLGRGRGRPLESGEIEELIEADAEHGVEREQEVVAAVADPLPGGQAVQHDENERGAADAREDERWAAHFPQSDLAGDGERGEEELDDDQDRQDGTTTWSLRHGPTLVHRGGEW